MDFVNTELAGWKLLFSLLLPESSYIYKLQWGLYLSACRHGQKNDTVPSEPKRNPSTGSTGKEVFMLCESHFTDLILSAFYFNKDIQFTGQFYLNTTLRSRLLNLFNPSVVFICCPYYQVSKETTCIEYVCASASTATGLHTVHFGEKAGSFL